MKQNNWKIEVASKKDIPAILEIIKGRCDWFLENKIDQWGDWYYKKLFNAKYFEEVFNHFVIYIVKENQKIIGTFLLKEINEKYWKDKKRAYYIDHFTSCVGYHGVGIFMLEFIENLALENGIDCLRLEAMRSNPKLNEYWKNAGFENKGNFDEPYEGVYWEKRLFIEKSK